MVQWMPKSTNRASKKIWCLLLRVLSYLLITFSSRIMIPSIQLNLQKRGCLKIMFCNNQVSPWIWIQLGTCNDFWKFKSKKSTPANINNLKTICSEEWYKMPTNYGKKLIENYRKRFIAAALFFVPYDYFFSLKKMNGMALISVKLIVSLYTHIRIYTYTVNV